MIYLALTALTALSERFFTINLGLFQIGFGDVFLIASSIIYLLYFQSINKEFFVLIIISVFIVLFSMFTNSSYSGFNTLISIPLKLFFGFVLYRYLLFESSKSSFSKSDIVLYSLFIVMVIMNLFFTGVLNPDLELFNRNELASYLMALFYLISVRLIITNRIARSSLPIVFFLAMMFVFFVTFSRQAIISSTLTLFIFTVFIGSTKSKFLIISACFINDYSLSA